MSTAQLSLFSTRTHDGVDDLRKEMEHEGRDILAARTRSAKGGANA